MFRRLLAPLVLALAVAACTTPAVVLEVTSVVPAPDAVDVPIDAVVSATFSVAIDPTTVDGAFSLEHAGGAVAGVISYNAATRTAVFTPDADLEYDTEYTATVEGTVATVGGVSLAGEASWSFTTEVAPTPVDEIDGVTVDPDAATVVVGDTVQLTADVSVVSGTPATTVTWTSSDDAIASVNATGLVTAIAPGTATITATSTFDASFSGDAAITVTAAPIPDVIDGVTVDPDAATVVEGDTVQLTADVSVVSGSPSTAVTWASDDETVATVDATGLVTAVAAGTATITATSVFDASFSGDAVITVIEPSVIDGVTIDAPATNVVEGGTLQLTADVSVVSGTPSEEVTWETSDETIALVDEDGLVTAVAPGTVTITAISVFDPSFEDSVDITVVALLEVDADYAPYAADANVNTAISLAFPAITGGLAPFTFELVAGDLPADFETQEVVGRVVAAVYSVELDPDTGEIAGATGFPGLFTGTVQVTDALGQTATADYELDLALALRYTAADLETTEDTFSYPSSTIPHFTVPGDRVQVSGVGDTDGLPDAFLADLSFALDFVSSNGSPTPTEIASFEITTSQGAITRVLSVPSITQWIYDVVLTHGATGETATYQVRLHHTSAPFPD